MSEESSDWRDALWTAHAPLFEGSSPFATGIGTLPQGWRELVESLCGRLTTASGPAGRVRVSRLEDDRAALHVSWKALAPHGGFEAEVSEMVARSTARSACTCQSCGLVGTRCRIGFSRFVACPLHMPRGAIEITPNWPTIRTTRAFVGGRSRIVACDVYDRGLDRFVAAAPASLGIEDSP